MTEAEFAFTVLSQLLKQPLADGGRKLDAGVKQPWWIDDSHEAKIFSHFGRWKKRELRDPDSNAHPLVHVACRALMLAYQDMHGKVKPSAADAEARRGKLDEARGCGTDL